MKINPKNDPLKFSLPLPIYQSVHIADAISREGKEFSMFVGLEKQYVEQLKNLSLDENDVDLQNNTGDYARFGEGSYEEWYGKNRTTFCLIDKQTDALAALIWFGPKILGKKSMKFGPEQKDDLSQNVDNWHTISWRAYPNFRGKGIMRNFTQFAMDIYKSQFVKVLFWAGMDDRNKAMVKLATELGFVVDEENSDLKDNWLVMIKL